MYSNPLFVAINEPIQITQPGLPIPKKTKTVSYKLRMTPSNSIFWLASGNLLQFAIQAMAIEIADLPTKNGDVQQLC